MRLACSLVSLLLLAACTAAPKTSVYELETAGSQSSHMIGMMAPPFTALDQDSKKVSLADYKGKWVVLYFFGHEDVPGCRCGANEYTALILNLVTIPASVVAISDMPPEDAQYSSDEYGIPILVLADPEIKVMPLYGACPSISEPVTRGTFLIDPTGRIVYHWPVVVPDGHVDRIKQKLQQLQKQQ